MLERIIGSHEHGRAGKPDRLDADIAERLAAQVISIDPDARCDIRVGGYWEINEEKGIDRPYVQVSGEVSSHVLPELKLKVDQIVKDHYKGVHNGEDDSLVVDMRFLKPQSHSLATNDGAGDSGTAIAVAFSNMPNNLPLERYLAVSITKLVDRIYRDDGKVPEYLVEESGVSVIDGLRADGKVSVEVEYLGVIKDPVVTDITLAINHETSLPYGVLVRDINAVVNAYLRNEEIKINQDRKTADYRVLSHPDILVNGAKAWQDRGGWKTDEGNRDAKPQEAYFGSHGVCEDAPWGEDPSKPSGTGTMLARYIANQIVGNGLADFAKVKLVYKIGQNQPKLNIVTNGTGNLGQDGLEEWVQNELGDLSIAATVRRFDLKRPELYSRIADNSDLFHDPEMPWNQIDLRYNSDGL